ncbi:hypothetical protein BC938DRAFT_480904 [Jimgerdemannia flammicorona]|uniref:AAA-ATPase-like domain-containing protein n=1 Tax=Jimgerdemannia flammicorona TaxID=994334 RepID=A0A433QX47_9FUNG|nr:hypothetical protein BC938DRAFT_480904 [Jimgerdemannia flammicorona]
MSYKSPVVLMLDEFDSYLLRGPHVAKGLQSLAELVNAVRNGRLKMIRSIVCAGRFTLSQLTSELTLQSPWNDSNIIEASNFSKENHQHFFRVIENETGRRFAPDIVEDIFSRIQGDAGFEGIFASKCIEWVANTEDGTLRLQQFLPRVIDFTRTEKFEVVNHVQSRLDTKGGRRTPLMVTTNNLLVRFLHVGFLSNDSIRQHESDALTYLRGLGIIKKDGDRYSFSSNLLFDLLLDKFYAWAPVLPERFRHV